MAVSERREPTLTDAQVDGVARQLAEAARRLAPVETLGVRVEGLADAYRVQRAGLAMTSAPLSTWKIGCTGTGSQQWYGIDEPVAGRYVEHHVVSSPALLAVSEFVTAPFLEVEIGFRLIADLDEAPLDAMQLADAVEVFAAVEVVSSRLTTFGDDLIAPLVADDVAAGRAVIGPDLEMDVAAIRSLDSVEVALRRGPEVVARGTGAAVMGHPLEAIAWLAGHAAGRGTPLRVGDTVLSGTCTGVIPGEAGSSYQGVVGHAEVLVDLA